MIQPRPSLAFRRWLAVAIGLVTSAALGQTPAELAAGQAEADRRCLQCHAQPHIATMSPAERRSMVGTRLSTEPADATPAPPPTALTGDEPAERRGLLVAPADFAAGPHASVRCIDCHADAVALPHAAKLQPASCAASCHAIAVRDYQAGSHQAALDRRDPYAPTCTSCHGGHDILRLGDRDAPQHKLNSVYLCGDCHQQHRSNGTHADAASNIADYLDSTHARAVTKAGLPMAATCADCHGAHGVRPSKDPESSVHRAHIPETCGKCHLGVAEVYAESVHGRKHAEDNLEAAVCTDCHTAHRITHAASSSFMLDVISECGRCHDSPDAEAGRVGTYYQTYAASYHGQVSKLGGTRAARCSDCHGAHDIRPLDDPESRVSKANLVATCGGCHPGSNAKFVRFDPHADHRDSERYPILYAVWLYFMVMMTTVFGLFGLHTVLWFVRSLVERAKHGRPAHHPPAQTAIRRFTTLDRINHAFVAITFFGLTATGIPLVFAHEPWARTLADLVGGIEAAGLWHRLFATLLIANFVLHFVGLARNFTRRTCSWKEWLFGPNSLVPRWKDAKDIVGMVRWFFGLGQRPRFDRWTYWEKFDYWAEVGGSVIIGGSGLLLWFPELAARIVPGWTFNVAMIIHGYEALLAIGFIFTIHFFNTHLRPGAFPVDEVIFTGSMPEHELKEQRPEQYERLVESGRIEAFRVPAPSPHRRPLIVTTAVILVGIGLILLALIIAGGFF